MFDRFKQRSYEPERLDTGDYTSVEYERWHREMWFIHRIFGEMRALKRSVFKAVEKSGKQSVSILDVGAGAGELLCELKKWTSEKDIFLAGAEINSFAAAAIRDAKINAVQCDALRLPFADNSFEYVFCSLFLHHLDDNQAVDLLREMGRVAACRIFVIDLNRHPTAYYLYKFLAAIFLQRFTREDGALSILRSFTPEEMLDLAEKAGLNDVTVTHSKVNRLILSGRVSAPIKTIEANIRRQNRIAQMPYMQRP